MDLTEPNFPVHDGRRCQVCHCPVEVGLFITIKYRVVCQVCWALYHNHRFAESGYWDNL